MSDQGFHEVQLSGKQLVFLFMSAVVVMVVVFLLGVNVGRGVRGAVGDTEVLAQSETPPAAPADQPSAPTTQAKPAQPELSYHDMLLAATPAADKAGAEKTTPPAAAPPPVNEAPTPVSETPAPTPTPKATPNPPAESKTPVTQSAPAQPPASGQKSSGAEWFLQTGAYSTQAVADGQVAKLKQLNVPAFVLPLEKSGKRLFHVRIGPYSDRAEAERVSSRLTRQGYTPSITR